MCELTVGRTLRKERTVPPFPLVPLLPFTELEPLPGAGASRLLALDCTRIPGHETGGPQLGPMLSVGLDQRSRNGVAKRARLAGLTAAVHVGLHIERAERVGGRERLLNVLHQGGTGEIVPQRPAVDVPLSRAGREVNPCHAGLPTTHRLPAKLRCSCHALTFEGVTENAFGCCATWGCSAPG